MATAGADAPLDCKGKGGDSRDEPVRTGADPQAPSSGRPTARDATSVKGAELDRPGVREAEASRRSPPQPSPPGRESLPKPKRVGRKQASGRPQSSVPVERARGLRHAATRQERRLWQQLRLLRPAGLHIRRQVPIGPFIADFACLKQGLVVELDGGQHSEDARARRDRGREKELARLGFRILRFWNTEVDQNLHGVVETILAAVAGEAGNA